MVINVVELKMPCRDVPVDLNNSNAAGH